MGYKYETHLHTKEGSACAVITGAEQVRNYYKAGYAGIIVTDHFFNGNTAIPRELPWEKRVELFCKGYENAKEEGDKLGMDVFFGWEAGFMGTEFLIYGLDKEWLLNNSDVLDWSVEEQYKHVKADGGYVVHAHPFREAFYIPDVKLFPDCVDAVEVINYSNDKLNPEYNKKAYQYAVNNGLPMTGGSDVHNGPAMPGGMEFEERLTDIGDYMSKVLAGECRVLGIETVL
ncbi:MAG: histidinol-phosphatase [Lachnospiraceae bacterium]|nr:histidinol-phosphatase [Lachnospiraceae bacterium]